MALLLINSCRKDRQNLPLTKTELITEARSFFENETVNLPKLNDNNVRHSLNKIPLWDKATIKKISIGEAVIVPIKYDYEMLLKPENDKTFNSLEKSSYLMIYKNKLQELQVEWVTVIPDEKTRGNKFVGTIAIEDWNGKFKQGFAFGADGDMLPIYSNNAITYRKIAFARSLYCITINHYGYVMDYPQIIGSETYCFGNSDGNTNNDITLKNGGGGGGTSPTDYSYTIDCNKVVNGTATWNEDCQTCIGGTTGLTDCPPKRSVTDSTTTPCIKEGVTIGKQANTTIGAMLNKTFGTSNEYGGLDLQFIEGNTGTDDGWCRKDGNVSWVITINQNLPNVSSKEYILSTIYHEILHAYLEATYPKNSTGMFLIPHDEHQDMAEKYIILMTGALKLNYPNLSDPEAWGLAWGGLQDTPFYNDDTKITDDQREEIVEINRKHKNKNNLLDRSGTYCN
ncbi:hypothetical protein [Pedobacter cryotolerans]|uniref:Uncharacterized protein n=1 Tax=Pedobacter cryotolerans TaxID=2571270 RepID=A0A4U1CBJ1_9SPHI|nr:hypothetical protein [Pedobacter cryotolerans]TKC03308.1 hypothetical protein FA045_01695 [Pedobacter cryotolerans]